MNTYENPLAKSDTYKNAIKADPEFRENLENNISTKESVGRIALKLSMDHKQHEFEHHMFKTIGTMEDFFEAQNTIDSLRRENHSADIGGIPKGERELYKQSLDTIVHFNGVLRETVEAAAYGDITYAQLMDVITTQHNQITGHDNPKRFKDIIRSTIDGMRNELAVENILTNNDVEFDSGTEDDDKNGGDIIINGIPIDIKSSENNANNKKQKAIERGENPDRIVWSQLRFEDFNGKLNLDPDTEDRIAPRLLAEIDRAAGTNYADKFAANAR